MLSPNDINVMMMQKARDKEQEQKTLALEVLKILNEVKGTEDSIRDVITLIKNGTGIETIGLRLREGDDYPYYTVDGFSEDSLRTENYVGVRDSEGDLCRDENGNVSLECTCGLVLSGQTDPENPLFTPAGSAWTNNAPPLAAICEEDDPRLNPRNRCIHEGYHSFALIPLRSGNEIVGLLHLADRRADRFDSEQIRFLEDLAHSIGIALKRKQLEETLRYKLEFETLIADIAGHFIDTLTHNLNESVQYALRRLGEFFLADRCYVFQFSADATKMKNTHEWCRQGIEPMINRSDAFLTQNMPWFAGHILARRHIQVIDTTDLPREAEAERKEFMHQGIKSLLCVPMIRKGTVTGFIGLDYVSRRKHWPDGQMSLLKIVPSIISTALDRLRHEERVSHLTYHDQLTGLCNRLFFQEELERLDVARELPIAFIMADLNGLKHINDTFGHEKGDELLKKTAGLLKRCCRRNDILARYGGDEFTMLLPRTGAKAAEIICKRIRNVCAATRDDALPVSIAVGYAIKDDINQDTDEILSRADQQMYRQKHMTHRRRHPFDQQRDH